MGVAPVPHHTPPAPAPAVVLQHAVTTLHLIPTVSVTIYSTLLDRETAMLEPVATPLTGGVMFLQR